MIPSREIDRGGVSAHMCECSLRRDIPRSPADDGGELNLPIKCVSANRHVHSCAFAHYGILGGFKKEEQALFCLLGVRHSHLGQVIIVVSPRAKDLAREEQRSETRPNYAIGLVKQLDCP